MSRAGFVLAGGRSSRMGRDKALLPFRGGTLGGYVAAAVASAAGSAIVIGDPQKYAILGYPVTPDRTPGIGPLGGIETALSCTAADWNLILACDMPGITLPFLLELLEKAEASFADAVIPCGPSGIMEPLCAVYHARCLTVLRNALDSGVRKVTAALESLRITTWNVPDSGVFENLNTPEEWACHDA
ncbi:MAG: molybdenum cofactor guanylyltransferase [Bryobacteraceae bacterium]